MKRQGSSRKGRGSRFPDKLKHKLTVGGSRPRRLKKKRRKPW